MSDKPLVTIAISTYNRADGFLPQALDSALAQTYPNVEIVVSDNCSQDETPKVVRERANERIRYFRQVENIGPNNNFNFCLRQAKGKYFLLLHDDDLIDPDFVSTCIAALPRYRDVGVIRTGTRVIDGARNVLAHVPNDCEGLSAAELFLRWFDRGTSFYLCSTLYNTELLSRSGGFRSKHNLFQDVVAIAHLAVSGGRVDVPDVLASFRRHGDNKGSSDDAIAWAEDSNYLLELLTRLMPEHAQELREAGRPYLTRKCYRNVQNIPSPVERWATYMSIYNRFGRTYSPLKWVAESAAKDLKGALGSAARRYRRSEPRTVRSS